MKINEILTYSSVARVGDEIRAKCGPYLNELGTVNDALFNFPLWRGTEMRWSGDDEEPIMYMNVVPGRPPRDTARILHDLADEWFLDHAGHRFRSDALFATGNLTTAELYAGRTGTVVAVIPCGQYQYCWSEVFWDMTHEIDDFVRDEDTTDDQLINKMLGAGQYMLNTGLHDAIKSGHEIMVSCKQAIGVPLQWISSIPRN